MYTNPVTFGPILLIRQRLHFRSIDSVGNPVITIPPWRSDRISSTHTLQSHYPGAPHSPPTSPGQRGSTALPIPLLF